MHEAPAITGVSEIVLSVADLPKMREFYTQVMGFSLHRELSMESTSPDSTGKPTISFLTICDGASPLSKGGHPPFLVLIDYLRHVHATARFAGHDVKQSTLNHLAFEVPPGSLSLHEDRLLALGIEITKSEFPALNAKAIFLKDPESNVLELICHHSDW